MSDPFIYRVENGALVPLYSKGKIEADRSTTPYAGGKAVGSGTTEPPPPTSFRDEYKHPYDRLSHFNKPLSIFASEASDTDNITVKFTTRNGTTANPTINRSTFSIGLALASSTDTATITDKRSGTVYTNIKVPNSYVPPVGGGGFAADAATVIVQPGKTTGYEFYKMAKVGTNTWECEYAPILLDMRGIGTDRGRRAGGMSYANGVIRKWALDEILAGTRTYFPWTLAMSAPKEALKKTPTSADGHVMYNGSGAAVAVWPARLQDNQTNVPYSGAIPMGCTFALRNSFNIDTWTIGGVAAKPVQKALARTLKWHGVTITDQSTTWALYAEPSCDATAVDTDMKAAWQDLYSEMRRVTNLSPTNVGGGDAPFRGGVLADPFSS